MSAPIDLVGIISRGLERSRRAPDEYLHPSSDIVGPLRHTQLALAGAPTKPRNIAADIRMLVGTLVHEWIEKQSTLEKPIALSEIDLTPFMPDGWSGTCDWLIFSAITRKWSLVDVKTVKGDAIRWKISGGVSAEHKHQVSAYYHAAAQLGLELDPEASILYVPITDSSDKPVPVEICFDPIPKDELGLLMLSRRAAADEYIASLPNSGLPSRGLVIGETDWDAEQSAIDYDLYKTKELAPIHPREHKLSKNGRMQVFDVKSAPHWSASFCPYPALLCGCSEQQGPHKIGHYNMETEEYIPRSGFETIEPEVTP